MPPSAPSSAFELEEFRYENSMKLHTENTNLHTDGQTIDNTRVPHRQTDY